MSRYLAQAAIALRKVKNQEPLDTFDIAIIDSSLTRTIQEQRVSLFAYRQKLTRIYQDITKAPSEKPDCLDARKLLDCFLNPERFRLLRS